MNSLVSTQSKSAVVGMARNALKTGNPLQSLELLRTVAQPSDSAAEQAQYARLARELVKHLSHLPLIRVAFLANSTLAHWVDCLRFWLLLEGFRLEPYLAPFGTWRQQILDQNSKFYQFSPDTVWFFLHVNDLHFEIETLLDDETATQVLSNTIADISAQILQVSQNFAALLVVNNIVLPVDRVFGNFEGSTTNSLSALIQRLNLDLVSALPKGSTIFDIAHLAAKFGLDRWEDARLWYHSKHPFSLDAQSLVAFSAARLLSAARGRARKCIILDLDNTLWGGVIGDDGVDGILVGADAGAVGEAYTSFQRWLKALTMRGIALAVCSKNNGDLAREPFMRKSGMILQLNDFAVFKANWENKVDNIRAIAQELNLGLESFVFVDDNPAERALVRSELPTVAVPELPTDPANYIHAIASGAWFETLGVTNEDRLRVRMYIENAARTQAQLSATNIDSYLSSLEMFAKWGTVEQATLQRVTQLINKTNQFHLTTTRYTELQIAKLAESSASWVGHFSLKDRFGDHGLISAVILQLEDDTAIIDTWAMSCRVFSREMENFIFKIIWNIAKEKNCSYLIGKYIPTSKNAVVAELYQNFGGTLITNQANQEKQWCFDLSVAEPAGTRHIHDISNQND